MSPQPRVRIDGLSLEIVPAPERAEVVLEPVGELRERLESERHRIALDGMDGSLERAQGLRDVGRVFEREDALGELFQHLPRLNEERRLQSEQLFRSQRQVVTHGATFR